MKRQILIIANPVAGGGNMPPLEKLLAESHLSTEFECSFMTTAYRGHASELAGRAANNNIYCVVAAGGDGTVNECASVLVNTSTALGIVPTGSGNGLARHLNYPRNVVSAFDKICYGIAKPIDTLRINGRFAVNVSGLGFDGYVAMQFDASKKRGLFTYTTIALKEYIRYPSFEYTFSSDGITKEANAMMVVIANASQFGNAAVIAPPAKLNDGFFDVITVSRPSLLKLPVLFYRLFKGTLSEDENVKMYRSRNAIIKCKHPVHFHIDGEPVIPLREVAVEMVPDSLLVIT